MVVHEYFEIDNCPHIRLSDWYRIYSINNEKLKEKRWIRFVKAYKITGEVIYYEVIAGSNVIVGVEYTDNSVVKRKSML